ncbi:MAG: polymer-forming cytoskeletal protein [Nannocystaceae bacterium]|nr:polymer-forming cytoskeletal protein [Nannocystaceae bacterium]
MDSTQQEKQTLVEEGTEFSGTLRATCKVVVRGEVKGELEAPAVEIADTGSVTGTLRAKTVRSLGTLAGVVEVDDIFVAGKVLSETVIRAKTLEVKLAAQEGHLELTFGDCVLEVGEMPGDQPVDDDVATTETDSDAASAEGATPDVDADADGSRKSRKRRGRGKKARGKEADSISSTADGESNDSKSNDGESDTSSADTESNASESNDSKSDDSESTDTAKVTNAPA